MLKCLHIPVGLALSISSAWAMDVARVETRVDDAVSQFGVTGKGVIVAILDRGVDWRNNDFRFADGTTRIAGMYDLTDDSGTNSPANTYHLGTLYTRDQIDAALAGGPNLPFRDALGHGTSTTGVACGNGNNIWKYRGVAYDATILSVKIVAENIPAHGDQPAETPFYDPARIPTAIQYVRDQANALGMPAVMLLNIGSVGGPMDGTSHLCQALDAAVGPGIPGFVFVTGSSDDGNIANHAAGTVTQGGSAAIKIHHGSAGALRFDLWYPANDRFGVSIDTPGQSFGPYVSPASNNDYDIQSNAKFRYYHLGGARNFNQTVPPQREIWVEIDGPTGDYTVTLAGSTVTSGAFNASLNPSEFTNPGTSNNYFSSFAAPGGTVWDLASATNNICPNDYVHRTKWTDIDNIPRSNASQGAIGDLWLGTGVGPTYDGRIGIDVSAPGDSVFTTYNTNSYWALNRFNEIQDGDGLYGRASATSAANPLVTGIIALLLQTNPKLDAPMVKQILHDSARSDSFTGPVPNNQWGWGKVDAYAAVAMAQKTLPRLSVVISNGEADVTVSQAVPGWRYILKSSTDLASWTPVATNTASANVLQITDSATADKTRFYQVLIP